jgi:hypothetical protein
MPESSWLTALPAFTSSTLRRDVVARDPGPPAYSSAQNAPTTLPSENQKMNSRPFASS